MHMSDICRYVVYKVLICLDTNRFCGINRVELLSNNQPKQRSVGKE